MKDITGLIVAAGIFLVLPMFAIFGFAYWQGGMMAVVFLAGLTIGIPLLILIGSGLGLFSLAGQVIWSRTIKSQGESLSGSVSGIFPGVSKMIRTAKNPGPPPLPNDADFDTFFSDDPWGGPPGVDQLPSPYSIGADGLPVSNQTSAIRPQSSELPFDEDPPKIGEFVIE